ncbi:putative disease resistance protein RGA1 [Rosa rugosa]|uniref:putative disease resistance protein RGA1 n=1 Tax=Rosa rugosa TaxID=74645 RepID=UPI002B41228C|nr:putative disease resistance protein RGA1 [Rosa rugosa]XP_062007863.1 putative disease resistance protein RGA1 [Rosa rugosa]XP_062007864.1 putative disease resistance protein RGA1 [Rosa rugosa]XP_062007865.1 putative disease resistance protein RGA1 [Rosa rugosa]XP_062007866.1 putative disease resistance protein RGA1 [Rosa rugosa]XP_062007867.1 putative disease resistance protein RGA1 [Rosa rugosa]XP_062007868.1 putative disease resistance protein RGA1 [Rosa rugosa]XP_062007869.1 putative d
MAEALVSFLVEQLGSFTFQHVEQHVKLVVNVEEEVATLTLNLKTIEAVLADAERRQVKENSVRRWLSNLKEVSYKIDDVVDEWSTEILKQQIENQGDNAIVPKKKVCFSIRFRCLCTGQVAQIISRHDIAGRVKELNGRLALIHEQRKQYKFRQNEIEFEQPERIKSVSGVDESETFGRDDERNKLVSQLVSEHSEERKKPLVISIVGMGGIGKTTLAKLAYNDVDVKNCFHTTIWVCVSEPFVQIAVAKAILESLDVSYVPNSNELETFFRHIESEIKGKKFLLVLDDVWDSNHTKWDPFLTTLQCGASGSRILITTRIAQVASAMGTTSDHTIDIKELGEKTCRSLFYHIAFFDGERKESKKFEDIGNEIVKKCKGLPLAAKTLGSLMRCKKTLQQWVDVLNSKIWELQEFEQEVFQPLLLSYYDLKPLSKRCLLYCATFPKDHVIVKDKLIELWMSQDYLEVKGGNKEKTTVGQWCFENLVTRSFFQDIEEDSKGNIRNCKMHDIVHDFVQYLTKDECFSMVVKGANERMELPGDEVRHLSLMFAPKDPFPVSSLNCKSLRTLTAFESKLTSIGVELISQSKSLRTLNLSENSIREVPKEIGGLIHLRYLDLSENDKLKELPDSLCDLYNLQTLRLVGCWELVKFPDEEAMRKLTKLKHLYVEGSCRLKSKGIGRLTGLQKLDVFHLNGYRGEDKEGTLKLQDLKNLKQLEGSLSIAHLESVEDASEGVKACLSEKHLLYHLVLDFICEKACGKWLRAEGTGQNDNDREILNGLQPHGDLESLSIWNCQLATSPCPDWILSLHNLTCLALGYYRNCELLSGPFGRLPSLEWLSFWEMKKVKKVGVEFLGIEESELQSPSSSSSSSSSSSLILFPKLKSLQFNVMREWEEWEGVGGDFQNNITIMPSLSRLQFWTCSKLGTLPDFLRKTPLQTMIIGLGCPILRDRVRDKTSEEWAKISHVPDIQVEECKLWRFQAASC